MSKWILGMGVAVLLMSLGQADGQGGAHPPEVLVLDLGRAVDKCDEHADVVAAMQKQADEKQKEYAGQVQQLQAEQKRLFAMTLTQRDKNWLDAVEVALKKEGELKAIEAHLKVKFSDDIARQMENLIRAAKEQAENIRVARKANIVVISKLTPVRFEKDADIKDELVSRRVLAHDESVDITQSVIDAMNKKYQARKKAAGN